MDIQKLKLGIFFKEAAFFSLAQILGIWVALSFSDFYKEENIPRQTVNIWQFIIYFLMATLFIFFFLKFLPRGGRIFRVFFVVIVFLGSSIAFGLLVEDAIALFLGLGLAGLWFFWANLWIHNLAIILSVAGVSGLWALNFTPPGIIAILALLSVYDFIAVYKTKHMVKMAKAMIEKGAIFALVIPEKKEHFKVCLREAKPRKGFLFLGAGDIALPLLLTASVAVQQNIKSGLLVFLFSLAGLFSNHLVFIFQRFRRPMPALPIIAFFSILGYIVTRFLFFQ